MHNALSAFEANIKDVLEIDALYVHLRDTLKVPLILDDLLRSQIVYAVSAFDKLIHDLVKIGILEIFSGHRPQTPKYLNESISLQVHVNLLNATFPPKEYIFEQEIVRKLKHLSYQDPDKVADGLSYIWNEKHKWSAIAAAMMRDEDSTKKQLRLIVDRRNNIVHEADIDLLSGNKNSITKTDCEEVISFIQTCARAIVSLVS